MQKTQSVMLFKEFSVYVKTINEIVWLAVVILILLLCRLLMDTLISDVSSFVKIVVSVAAAILVVTIIAFRFYYIRAINSIAKHADRYNTLLNVTKEIRQEKNIVALCEKILDYAIAITGANAGAILLYDNNNLTVRATRGSDVILDRLKKEPCCGPCLVNGTCKKNCADDVILPTMSENMKKLGISSLICQPLRHLTSISGVIRLAHISPGKFSTDDLKVVEYFSSQAAISLDNAIFVEGHVNFEQHMTDLLLQAMDNHLPVKVEHARRVAQYSRIIALNIGFNEDKLKRLNDACLLHDIGFIKFLPEEEMKRDIYLKHVTIGHSLLNQIIFLKQIAEVVLHHHERYDGEGYPSMLKGENIPLESRIIAIAESFDAITNRDSYRTPIGFSEALAEMHKNAGTQFDPVLLDTFIRNVGEVL